MPVVTGTARLTRELIDANRELRDGTRWCGCPVSQAIQAQLPEGQWAGSGQAEDFSHIVFYVLNGPPAEAPDIIGMGTAGDRDLAQAQTDLDEDYRANRASDVQPIEFTYRIEYS